MGVGSDEKLVELAVRSLLAGLPDQRRLVRDLVAGWPDCSPLELMHVLAMAAGSVEAMFAGPSIARAAQDCWRMVGLMAVDLRMMEVIGLPRDKAADLLAYWKVHDRFFLG